MPAERRTQEEFLFRLFRTCFTLQVSLDRRFLKSGVTFQEAVVLLQCVRTRGITPGRLALTLGRDKGKITRFVDRLVARGLVVRDPNPGDRRITRILPTDQGKLAARRFAALFERVRKELFANVRTGELRQTENTLPKLYDNAIKLGRKGPSLAAQLKPKAMQEEKGEQATSPHEEPGNAASAEDVANPGQESDETKPLRITKAQIDDLFPR